MAKSKNTKKTQTSKQQLINNSNSHKALAIIFFGVALFCVAIVSLALFVKKDDGIKHNFESLKYDIVIEKHRYQYEGVDPTQIPIGGYSNTYYYTVVNSELHEKYTIAYEDVWDVHNARGDYDTITIETTKVGDDELNSLIEAYGKLSQQYNVKDFFEDDVEESYIIKGSKEYEQYLVNREKANEETSSETTNN